MFIQYHLLYMGIFAFAITFPLAPNLYYGLIPVAGLQWFAMFTAYCRRKVKKEWAVELFTAELHIAILFALFAVLKLATGNWSMLN